VVDPARVRSGDVRRDVDALLTLLAALLVTRTVADVLSPPARRAAVTEPWAEEPRRLPPPPEARMDWCMCPRGHVAYLRPDGDSFCDLCGELYLNADFAATYGLDRAA
jgi:hypothetical protein